MFCAKRIFKKSRDRGVNIASKDMRVSNFYAPSPIDSFVLSKHENAHTDQSIRCTSDIYMLFNQQRLDRMSREALLRYFDDMQIRESSLSSLRSRMSDDQLITLVKSRYVQSQGELLAWSRYLNSLADTELQAYLAKSQTPPGPDKPDKPVEPVEPAPAPSE